MRDAILSNIFMIIVIVGYTIFVGVNYYKFTKYAGAKQKSYKHRSTTKTMGYVIAVLGIFYLVMFTLEKNKSTTMYVTVSLFIYFVIIISSISIRDIVLYENGIYYSGKFVKYIDMKDVEKIGKNGVQIQLNKKKLTGTVFMNKVQNEQDFIKTVKKNIKTARKNKKLEERTQNQKED